METQLSQSLPQRCKPSRNQTIPLAGMETGKRRSPRPTEQTGVGIRQSRPPGSKTQNQRYLQSATAGKNGVKWREMSHRLQSQSINECVKGNLWQQESDNPARRDGNSYL